MLTGTKVKDQMVGNPGGKQDLCTRRSEHLYILNLERKQSEGKNGIGLQVHTNKLLLWAQLRLLLAALKTGVEPTYNGS